MYFSNILGLPLGFWMIFTSFKWAPEKVGRAACRTLFNCAGSAAGRIQTTANICCTSTL